MTQEKSVLPMNWGSFLALPIEWLDVRLAEKARRVKLRDVGNGVLDLSLARIFTPCEPAGFNKDFFEEFTGCIGWQVPSNENEAFAMLLSFCAMTRAISTSGAAEGLLKEEVEDKEVQLESYEELKRILWLPTVKTEWLEEHFQGFLAELHSTAAWAMTVHLIGQLEAVEILDPRDQITAISKAFQQQILTNEVDLLTNTGGHDGKIQRGLQARWRAKVQPISRRRRGGGEDGGFFEPEQPWLARHVCIAGILTDQRSIGSSSATLRKEKWSPFYTPQERRRPEWQLFQLPRRGNRIRQWRTCRIQRHKQWRRAEVERKSAVEYPPEA